MTLHTASVVGYARQSPMPLGTLLACLACVVLAGLERVAALPQSSYQTLTSVVLGLGLPLYSNWAVSTNLGARNLDSSLAELARHGSHRWRLLVARFVSTTAWSMGFAVVATSASLVVAGAASIEALVLLGGVGTLAAAAYCAMWLALSSVGGGRRARFVGLISDWVLGSSAGLLALPWPRHHLLQTLAALDGVQTNPWTAATGLAACGVAWATLTLWRTPS